MTSSDAPTRFSSRPLHDLVGIAENVTSGRSGRADPGAASGPGDDAEESGRNPRCQCASGLGFCGGVSSGRRTRDRP